MGICLAFFGMLAVPPITTFYFLLNTHWIFKAVVFIAGLLCWTFIEYFVHRFWLHKKEDRHYYNSNHFFHHTQPKNIFTTVAKRIAVTLVAILLLTCSILYSRFLFLPAGIATGYTLYGYMHVWLHQPWAARWFGRLQIFHMQHHCGQTEKCFGVTSTWWDRVFNTMPLSEKNITSKIREVYFGSTDKQRIMKSR